MQQTDKSLQSEKFKQAVGGLGKPLGKSPAPDRIQSPRDLDRSFPCWPGSGYFGTAAGGVLSTAEGPRRFQLGTPDRHRGLRTRTDGRPTSIEENSTEEDLVGDPPAREGGFTEGGLVGDPPALDEGSTEGGREKGPPVLAGGLAYRGSHDRRAGAQIAVRQVKADGRRARRQAVHERDALVREAGRRKKAADCPAAPMEGGKGDGGMAGAAA